MKLKHYIDLILNKKNQLLESMGISPPSNTSSPSSNTLPSKSGFNLTEFLSMVPRVPYAYRDNQPRHAHLNLLEPFILPNMFNIDTKNLASSGRIMSPEQYEKVFKETINLKNFMSESQAPILKKMYDDLKFVHDALLPLKKFDMSATIDLTGGAVRDFILGKADKIKDLDVMISLSNYSSYKARNISEEDFLNAGFTKENLAAVSWDGDSDWDKDENVVTCKLIELCFERHKAVTNKYFHSWASRTQSRGNNHAIEIDGQAIDTDYEETAKDRLQGVIKIAHPSCNYEIDLLVTDLSKPEFLQEFDIDLCKASFSICNAHYKTSFPKDYSHLISRFIANQFFWADVVNKTLTINVDGKSQKMIASTIEKHLPRLEDKYPDYKAQFYHPINPKDSVLEFGLLAYKLNKEIPSNKPSTAIKHKI